MRNDRQKSRELEKVRRKADAASREIARLRKELAFTKGKSDTKKLRRYNETINELRAIDWLQKGWALENSGDYLGALNAFTRAIKLDPTATEAEFDVALENEKDVLKNAALALEIQVRATAQQAINAAINVLNTALNTAIQAL